MTTTFDAKNKIWKGPQNKCVFNTNAGLGEILLAVLARSPNKITQISDNNGVALTCKELRDRSVRLAENLVKKGYKFGDMIATISRNNHDVSAVIFGCNIIGAPINCLDPSFTVEELANLLNITRPKLVFCETFNLANVKTALEKVGVRAEIILVGDTLEGHEHVNSLFTKIDGLIEDHYTPLIIQNPEKHPSVILCSSGTTGQSKGVCLSHSHVIAQCSENWGATQDDSLLCFSSLYWVSGMMSLVYGTMSGMTRIITTETFCAKTLCNIIEKYKVTSLIMPPSQVSQLLSYEAIDRIDFSSIRYFLSGGSYVSDNLRKRMQKYLKPGYGNVIVGYGLTEIGGLATMTHPVNKLGSVGTLVQHMRAKVIDEITGENLGYKEPGEIHFKYDFTFIGYYGDEKKTREALDADGWVRSGDIGYFDKDNHLIILDRMKDIIKYRGFQISPSDIESALQQATGILSLCVVGIEDVEHGTDLPAVLIQKSKSIAMTPEDVIKVAEDVLPDYKRLRGGCYFVDSLPMTPSGKIQRRVAKEIANKLYQASLK